MNALSIIRTGRLLAKGRATDPIWTNYLVREWSDGSLEYYHTDFFDWYDVPVEWTDRREVTWFTAEEIAATAKYEAECDRAAFPAQYKAECDREAFR